MRDGISASQRGGRACALEAGVNGDQGARRELAERAFRFVANDLSLRPNKSTKTRRVCLGSIQVVTAALQFATLKLT